MIKTQRLSSAKVNPICLARFSLARSKTGFSPPSLLQQLNCPLLQLYHLMRADNLIHQISLILTASLLASKATASTLQSATGTELTASTEKLSFVRPVVGSFV